MLLGRAPGEHSIGFSAGWQTRDLPCPCHHSGLLTQHSETRLASELTANSEGNKTAISLIFWSIYFLFVCLGKPILLHHVDLNTMGTTLLIKPVKVFIIQMRLSPLNSYSCCINFCYENEIPGVEYFFRRIRRKKRRRKWKKRKKMSRRMIWKMKLFFVWG